MNSEKKFDAVGTMREIRDRLSSEITGMSFEEQKRYIKERINVRFDEAEKVVNDIRAA